MKALFKRFICFVKRWLPFIEVVAIVVGFAFTWVGLAKNTESNQVATRAMLYETEHVVLAREYEFSNTALPSMYSKPLESVTDPRLYCEQRMAPLKPDVSELFWTAQDEFGKPLPRVEALYNQFYGLRSFDLEATKDGKEAIVMRRMYAHMATVLDHMHAAYDFHEAISAGELETWKGYISDIGAHPIFLATIWTWREQKYFSKHFAEYLRDHLISNETDRKVVEYLYPDMLCDAKFLSGLPEYGKRRAEALPKLEKRRLHSQQLYSRKK